nr:uncharacterized protein LOC109168059 [Ipomoea trifida]
MSENMKPMMPKVDIASEFLAKVKELSMSEIADKSIAGNLMTELTSMKFDWFVPIHDYCDQMANIATKLKGMGMELSESWLVHLVINSLPPAEFGQFHMNYNTLKEKWSFKETKHLLVQEETRLKKLRHHSIHFTSQGGSSTNKRKSEPHKVDIREIHAETSSHENSFQDVVPVPQHLLSPPPNGASNHRCLNHDISFVCNFFPRRTRGDTGD